MENRFKITCLSILFFILISCEKTPEFTDEMLDGELIVDSSLLFPSNYLVSISKPNPTPVEASVPVFMVCHGYSATTFEWKEFTNWIGVTDQYLVSRVLLGGHGRSYEDFKAASWRDWQWSIKEEYEALLAAGYTNINWVGSSTSCALMLELLTSDYFDDKPAPKNVMLVDPIVIPSSKILSLVGVIGPVLGYVSSGNEPEEMPYWYSYRPQETLRELQDIINVVRKQLEKGVKLPANCSLKVYKSLKDPTADPVSAVLIYKGLKTVNGAPIDLEMVSSELHVFTRLALRKNPMPSDKDSLNQLKAFQDFIDRVDR